MSITSGKFEADLFVMTNATNFETNAAYQVPATEVLTPDGSNEVELAHTPVIGTVSIAGMEETSQTVSSGKFKVTTTSGNTPPEVVFHAPRDFRATLISPYMRRGLSIYSLRRRFRP